MHFIKSKRTYILITLILLLGFSSGKFVQGQEFNYLGTLVPDASYEWIVTKLDRTGTLSTPFLDFGNETLAAGDTFSVKIIEDISTLTDGDPYQLINSSNTWAEFYLNGIYKSNATSDIGLFELDWMSWSDGEHFFFQPITFTNATDTYNYFVLLQNNFEQINDDIKSDVRYVNYYENAHWVIKQSSSLSKSTWTIKYDYRLEYIEEDYTGTSGWSKDDDTTIRRIEIRFNVESGLVSYLSYYYNSHAVSEVDGLTTTDDDIIDLLIESTQLPTGAPYNWLYSIFGILAIGMVAYRKRRK